MAAQGIGRDESLKRTRIVRRVRQSSALEGGQSSRQARSLQHAWASGTITYAEFGRQLEQLRPKRRA